MPQEEVPLYESKGKQFAKKPALPVGLCPLVAQAAKEKREKLERQKQKSENKVPGLIPMEKVLNATAGSSSGTEKKSKTSNEPCQSGRSSGSNKGAKTKENNKSDMKQLCDGMANVNVATNSASPEDDISKQIKKLRKKIRAIETIEEKLKSGELKKPEQDQLDKVARKDCILKQIKQLEDRQK